MLGERCGRVTKKVFSLWKYSLKQLNKHSATVFSLHKSRIIIGYILSFFLLSFLKIKITWTKETFAGGLHYYYIDFVHTQSNVFRNVLTITVDKYLVKRCVWFYWIFIDCTFHLGNWHKFRTSSYVKTEGYFSIVMIVTRWSLPRPAHLKKYMKNN